MSANKSVSFAPPTSGQRGPLPAQQRPPDIGLALGNVLERPFEGGLTGESVGTAPMTRRARKAMGIAPQANTASQLMPAAQSIASAGFPKAQPRQLNTAPTTTKQVYKGYSDDTVPADQAPVHVDRNALYAKALVGEGTTTLHERKAPPPTSPAHGQFSSTTTITLDLSADDLALAGAVSRSDNIQATMRELLETGSVDPTKVRVPIAQPVASVTSSAPPHLAPALRLILKLLRSPITAHNTMGVDLLDNLCRCEPSACVAILWGGGASTDAKKANRSIGQTDATIALKDNYDQLHKYLTEAGQDPSAAMQAQLRFNAMGTGGLLAQTTTPALKQLADSTSAASGNNMEWPANDKAALLDKEGHQQLVYEFHKALSPARFLDTIINHTLRASCGYKRPCANLTLLRQTLGLLSQSLLVGPSLADLTTFGDGELVPHQHALAGVAIAKTAAPTSTRHEGLDHDAIDELLASSAGDGNRSEALHSLGLGRVFFEHVLPLLKEADVAAKGGEANVQPAHSRRHSLQLLWSLCRDPLVGANDVVREYILHTEGLRVREEVEGEEPPAAPQRYHARYYDLVIGLIDGFVMNDLLLAGLDPSEAGGQTQLSSDVALVCAVLQLLCYTIAGVAIGSTEAALPTSEADIAILHLMLAKAADTSAILSAMLDGYLTGDTENDSGSMSVAWMAVLHLQETVMQCYVYAAEVYDSEVNEGRTAQWWAWVVTEGGDCLQRCANTIRGHMEGVSEGGMPIAKSVAAAAILLGPLLGYPLASKFALERRYLLGPPVNGSGSTTTLNKWIGDAYEMVVSTGLLDALLQGLLNTLDSDMAASLLTALLTAAPAADPQIPSVTMLLDEVLRRFTANESILMAAVRCIGEGLLLPLVRMAEEDGGDASSGIQIKDSMSSTAAALQIRIISDWQRHQQRKCLPTAQSGTSLLRLLLATLSLAEESEIVSMLKTTLVAEGVLPMLSGASMGGRTLVIPLLSQPQIRLLRSLILVVDTPTIKARMNILLCALLTHPSHKQMAPPDEVAAYAVGLVSVLPSSLSHIFTGSTRLLLSLTFAYLLRLPTNENADDESESAVAKESSPISNIFAFKDPPLNWFYSDGQVFRDSALSQAEEDDGDDDVAGAILHEESRKHLDRAYYNERQGIGAWMLWIAAIVTSVSDAGHKTANVSTLLLHLDELLVNVWLWRMRLASVGVTISPSDVSEYTTAVIRRGAEGTVADLHTIHVGAACDALLAALVKVTVLKGFMREGPLRRVIDSMPNITATLGFVTVPTSLMHVTVGLMAYCKPTTVIVPTNGVALSPHQAPQQRLRAQVFASLAKLVCVVEAHRQQLGDDDDDSALAFPDATECPESASWLAWNSQQFTDVIIATAPTLKRYHQPYPASLNVLLSSLQSQLACAVPFSLIQKQPHASTYSQYRWGPEASEAVWEVVQDMGMLALLSK